MLSHIWLPPVCDAPVWVLDVVAVAVVGAVLARLARVVHLGGWGAFINSLIHSAFIVSEKEQEKK